MKRLLLLSLFAFCTLLFSCKKDKITGTGLIITEPREVANFYSVTVNGSSDVYISQGNNFEVKVKAYENLLPYLETKLQNGALLISYKNNSNISNDNSEIYITMPSLVALSTSGSGDINSSGNFLNADNFSATISGSGNINIENSAANQFKGTISGSGNLNCFGLVAKAALITIGGSGNAKITVLQNLTASIKGSGNVYYKGATAVVQSEITGSGQVIKQ